MLRRPFRTAAARSPRHDGHRRLRPVLESMEVRQLLSTTTSTSTNNAITVSTLADENTPNATISLREALALAALNPGNDVITFASGLSGSITLSLGELVLDDRSGAVSIEASPSVTTIDAAGGSRVLRVAQGTTATLSGLTITGGRTTDDGGGILNSGFLTLNDATLTNNAALAGGAIMNLGTMRIGRSSLSGSYAYTNGGGILNAGTMVLSDSSVTDSAATVGGGVFNTGPALMTVSNTKFFRNAADSNGGGIRNDGQLALSGSVVSNSVANYGGGIANMGTMSLLADRVSHNLAYDGSGGGVFNYSGSLSMQQCTVENNAADFDGGGLSVSDGSVEIHDTDFRDNKAGRSGGGLSNSASKPLTLFGGSIVANDAGHEGGGVWNAGTMTITGSTLAGNNAGVNGGGLFNTDRANVILDGCLVKENVAEYGGGLYNTYFGFEQGGMMTLVNSTISKNTAKEFGGGIQTWGNLSLSFVTVAENVGGGLSRSDGRVELSNSLFSDNQGSNFSGVDVSTSIVSLGHNLSSDGSATWSRASDLVGVNAKLGPLADHGGSTWTYSLLADSPALDAGSGGPALDQRGLSRLHGARPDIGAFEAQDDIPNLPTIPDQTIPDGQTLELVVSATVTDPSIQHVTLSFVQGQKGASLDENTGRFRFRPQNGPGVYFFTVRATEDGPLNLSTTTTFQVHVVPAESILPGTVQFASTAFDVNESQSQVTITVTRTQGTAAGATVGYITGDGTGQAGVSYVPVSGTLYFAAGEVSKTFTVPLIDDALFDGDRTVHLRLVSPGGGATLGAGSSAVLTIHNNDAAPPSVTPSTLNVMFKKGGLATIAVRFTGSLYFGADNPSSYRLFMLVARGRKTVQKPVALKAIRYDSATSTILITPGKGLAPNARLALQLSGNAILDSYGRKLGAGGNLILGLPKHGTLTLQPASWRP